MSSPDGQEQREADAQERSWRDDERIDAIEDRADTDESLLDIAAHRIHDFEFAL